MLSHEAAPRVYLLISASLLTLGGLGALAILWVRTFEQIAYVGILLVFTALVGALAARGWFRQGLDWCEPGIVMGFLFLASFGFAGLRYFLTPEALHPLLQGDLRWLTTALLFTLLGLLALWSGYYGRLGLVLHRLTVRPAREQVRARAVVRIEMAGGLYVLGLMARLVMLRTGLYGYLKQPEAYTSVPYAELLVRLEALCTLGLVLAWLDAYSHPENRRRGLFAGALLVSELFWGFVSGMKIYVLMPLVLVAIIHAYKRGRLPVRYVATAMIVLILIYPVNGLYRQMVRTGEMEIRGPTDIVNSSGVLVDEILLNFDDPNLYLGMGYESAIARTSLIQNYALLLKYLDQTGDYWHGRTIWMLPALIVVPRAVWPDKPVADTGYWFSVQVWGEDPRARNSIAITWPGLLHLQFGLPSVLLGMFLVGILLRLLYERYGRPRSNYSLFFYVMLLSTLLRIDDDLSWLLAGAVRTFAILWLISLVAFRYPRSVHSPAHQTPPVDPASNPAGITP